MLKILAHLASKVNFFRAFQIQQTNLGTHHTSPRRRRDRVQPSRAQRSRRPRDEQTSPERSRRSEGTKRTRDRSEKSTERKRIKAEKVEFDDPDLFTQSDPDVPSTSSGRAHRALARKSSQSGDEIKKTSKRLKKGEKKLAIQIKNFKNHQALMDLLSIFQCGCEKFKSVVFHISHNLEIKSYIVYKAIRLI